MNRSNLPNRYEPLVQMAREMSLGTGAPAQAHFDCLLALLRGPSRIRRGLWYLDRHRRLAIATLGAVALAVTYLAI